MPLDPLTGREEEVLRLLAQGRRNREIASVLSIGESTVETHLFHIYKKLGVRNRLEAVLIGGQQNGLQEHKDQGNPG